MSNDETIDQAVLDMLKEDPDKLDMVWDINMEKMQYKTAAFLLADPNDYILELFGVMYNTRPTSIKIATKSSSIAMVGDGEGFDLDDMNELMSVFFIGRDETNPLIKKYGGLASAIRTALSNTASEINIESYKNGTPLTYSIKKVLSSQPTKADKLKSMRFGDTQLTFQNQKKSSVKKGIKITIKKEASTVRQVLDLFTTKGIPEYGKIHDNCDFSLIPVELNGKRLEGNLFQTKGYFIQGENIQLDAPEYVQELQGDGLDARLYFAQGKYSNMVRLLKSGVSYPNKNIDLINRPYIAGIIDSQEFMIDMGKDRGIKVDSSVVGVKDMVRKGIESLYTKMMQDFRQKLSDQKKGIADLHSLRSALQSIAMTEIDSLWQLYKTKSEENHADFADGSGSSDAHRKSQMNANQSSQDTALERSYERIRKVTFQTHLYPDSDFRRELAKLPIVEKLDGSFVSLEDVILQIERNAADSNYHTRIYTYLNDVSRLRRGISGSNQAFNHEVKGYVQVGYSKYALDDDLVIGSFRATDNWLKAMLTNSGVIAIDVNSIQDERDKKKRLSAHIPMKKKATIVGDYVKGFFRDDQGKRKSLTEMLGEAGIGIVGGIGILAAGLAIAPLIVAGVAGYFGIKYTYVGASYAKKKTSKYMTPIWNKTKKSTKYYSQKSLQGIVDYGLKPTGKILKIGATVAVMPVVAVGMGVGIGVKYTGRGIGAAGRWTGRKIQGGFEEIDDGYHFIKRCYNEQVVDRYKAWSMERKEAKQKQELATSQQSNIQNSGMSAAYAGRGITPVLEASTLEKKEQKTEKRTAGKMQYFWHDWLESIHKWRADRIIRKEKRKSAKQQQDKLDLETRTASEEQNKLTKEARMVQLKEERWRRLRNEHADVKQKALEKAGFVVQSYMDFIHSLEGLPKEDVFVGLSCYIHNETIDGSKMDTKGALIFRTRDSTVPQQVLSSPEYAASVLAETKENTWRSTAIGHVFINTNLGNFEQMSDYFSTKYGAIAHSPIILAYLNKENTERLLWSTRRYKFIGFQPEQESDKKSHFDNVNPISMQVLRFYYDKFQYLKDERVADVMDLYMHAQNDEFTKAYQTLDTADAKKLVTKILMANGNNPTLDSFIEATSPDLVKEVGRTLV